MQGNSGAEMLELNAMRFAGLGVGHVPKFHTITRVRAPRNAPQIMGGIIVALWNQGNQGKASALAPMLQLRFAHAASFTKSIRLPT